MRLHTKTAIIIPHSIFYATEKMQNIATKKCKMRGNGRLTLKAGRRWVEPGGMDD
jgi:hypothetical protein